MPIRADGPIERLTPDLSGSKLSDVSMSSARPAAASTTARNRFFAAPPDDPRARRPSDVAIVTVAMGLVAALGWHHRVRGELDRRVAGVFDGELPDWLSGIATIVFITGGLAALALIVGIAVWGRGRLALVRDMVAALGTTLVLALAASYLAGPEFPDLLPELLERDGFPSYPVVRLAAAVAVVRVAQPGLTAPVRRLGNQVIAAMALSAIVLSFGTLSATLGGLALGFAGAAIVHLVFGSGLGIPSLARIEAALREIRIEPDQMRYLDRRRAGATLVAFDTGDAEMVAKVYGRDSAAAALAARTWRTVWYRDGGVVRGASVEQLAEHESFMLLACERAEVRAQRLVGWSRSSTGDALVVTEALDGHRLDDLEPRRLDDTVLERCWDALADLHAASITHGAVEPGRVVVTASGEVLLIHFDQSTILPGARAFAADRAQLLVTLAIVVGVERAVASAVRGLEPSAVEDLLPLLQPAALSYGLLHDARRARLDVDDLRNATADALDLEPPDLEPLQRVSWKNVAMAVLTFIAFTSLISSLTEIGFDTIGDQLADASVAWLVVAFVLAQLTNVAEYVQLVGVAGLRVPFGPTIMFRYALSFVGIAVPGDAAEIAMNVRYQQKLGVPPAAAVAQGPLLTLFSKSFDILLLIVSARMIGQAIDTSEFDLGPIVRLILLILVAVVVGVVAILVVPSWRAVALPQVQQGLGAVKGSVTDPHRLSRVVVGTLAQKVLYAMTLAAAVSAFGHDLGFGAAIFVNSAVSLFVGLVPVPGGLGVAEAALTAGLVAAGVPEEIAVAAAISHRLVTAYLPPVFGWYGSKWLTGRGYL
jgi:uncharacterized membrane protein YbhN (UPF0104 family)